MADPKVNHEFTTALPKCELHAHLSGSISRECLHEIWKRKKDQGHCLDLKDPITAIRPGGDFVDVVTFFPLFDKYIYQLCNDVTSVKFATTAVLDDFARDGVRYLELRTTPRECGATEMRPQEYVAAVSEVVKAWNAVNGERMEVYLILSVDRKMTAEQAEAVVDMAIKYQFQPRNTEKSGYVVAVDLCGNPARGNPSIFSPAFRRAKSHQLGSTLHFAEVPQSSSDAELELLLSWEPDRLGHGIHIPARLEQEILDRKIALELCLSCNVLGKLTAGGFSQHHFGKWYNSECGVALGTDDVGIFGSPLSNEYLLAATHFGLSASETIRLSRKATNVAFAGKERMNRLIEDFELETMK